MIADPENLAAALRTLLLAKGHECHEGPVRVAYFRQELAPAAYLITVPACCASVLTAELARLTGRLLLPTQNSWVFFYNEAQRIVTNLAGQGDASPTSK